MELTLGAAARLAELNKTTLSRHIKAGRLSARRLDGGSYAIDASELARTYGLQLDATGTRLERCIETRPISDPSATLVATEDGLATELRAQLMQAQATVTDLRTRLDASEARLDRVLLSLPAPTSRSGFLRRLFNRS